MDAILLSSLTAELKPALLGARVDKIRQPERDELIFTTLRSRSVGSLRLLMSANPSHPRLHLTELSKEVPLKAPMFCMLLRKHLIGARLRDIVQPPLERLLEFKFDAADELGSPSTKTLVFEALGRQANIILLDDEERIIDSIRRVDGDISSKRLILPGLFYQRPRLPARLNPYEANSQSLETLLENTAQDVPLEKLILSSFGGISPLVCRELAYRSTGRIDSRLSALNPSARASFVETMSDFFEFLRSGEKIPFMLFDGDEPADFSFMRIHQFGSLFRHEVYPCFSTLLESFFEVRDAKSRMRQKSQSLTRSVSSKRDRIARRLGLQRLELEATKQRDKAREAGDLIMANLHRLKQGDGSLTTSDYFDPSGAEVTIALNPLLTPQQNAAKYYKDYTKARNAEKYLSSHILEGEAELNYLNSVLDLLSRAENQRDIDDIRQELADAGYLKKSPGKKKQKQSPASPYHFVSSEGFSIYVGRNNQQNDLLTLKRSSKNDIWLHSQKIHGSHVIISCQGQRPGKETLAQAAALAAYYSQARESGNVPVDYTLVRNVKKPAGAKPGMVIYDNFKTIYADPDYKLVSELKAD